MPPKKMKKRKTKQKSTTSNINKQTVIINQPAPVKRKNTRRKKNDITKQFSTPESAIGQVFNLLRFIPQYPQHNYQSLTNLPKSPYIPMLDDRQHNYDDDNLSSISGSSRDLSDTSSFKQDKKISHKPASLSNIEEEGGGGGRKPGKPGISFKPAGLTPGIRFTPEQTKKK